MKRLIDIWIIRYKKQITFSGRAIFGKKINIETEQDGKSGVYNKEVRKKFQNLKVSYNNTMQQKQQQEEQLKIPQTIDSHKRNALMYKIISTVTGINEFSMRSALISTMVFGTFIVLKFLPNVPYGACIGVNIAMCALLSIINKLFQGADWSIVHQCIMSGFFGYLWSHHLFYSQQLELIVLTLISIGMSIGPIIIEPVPQFTSPTLYVKQLNVHSVLYVRLLLPLPLFLIQLVIDYGGFIANLTHHMHFIRLVVSLVFLTWSLGWISTLYNTYFFLINNINKLLFGDQTKTSFTTAFVCLVLNCVPIAIYLGWAEQDNPPVWVLWIGSSLTSFITFIFSFCFYEHFRKTLSLSRSIVMIVTECLICGGLVALMLSVDFSTVQSPVNIIAIIDLAIYLFFVLIKFLSVPRNWLGLSINVKLLNRHYMRAVQRIMLRMSAGLLVIILVQNLNTFQLWTKLDQTLYIDVDLKFTQYFFVPFLIYRSFKRSLSQSTSFSFHFSVLICLALVYNNQEFEAILTVLFFPPFPHSFLMTLVTPFTTPKKLKHKFESIYQIIYLCLTIAAIIIHVLSLGILQFTMFFGLPFFMPVLPTINEGSKVKSKQHSLYQKIVEYIPAQLLTFQKQGFYLIRISKYIMLVQIKQQWYGFGQIIDIKGLQVQQVTSCHSKQGETIDKLVEETWGDNIDCLNCNHLWTVLSPLDKCIIHVPTQNQIQLTGIIESKQFIQLFKEGALKGLIWEISRLTYSQKQIAQGDEIIGDFSPICKKEKFQGLFPFKFAQQLDFEAQYPESLATSSGNKKKLPPIKNKKQVVNDFMDLLESSSPGLNVNLKAETSTHYFNSGKRDEPKQIQDQPQNQKSQKHLQQNTNKINLKQLNACLVMTLYHYSVGKFDYFNSKKIYDLINKEKAQLSQVKFQSSDQILSKALSKAFKIAVDKITMGQTSIQLSDFEDYQKTSFLGIAGSEDFNNAVAKDLEDIWTLNYKKGTLSVKRLAKSQNDLYLLQADGCIIKSIWNNLRFELMYAANDNDERYSIQTHPSLMRNLWTEACEEPFGYPSYHSGNLMN